MFGEELILGEVRDLRSAFSDISRTLRQASRPAKRRADRDEPLLWKSLAIRVRGRTTVDETGQPVDSNGILANYADKSYFHGLKLVLRATTNPASTTVAGWAAELLEAARQEWISTLSPVSAVAALAGPGGAMTLAAPSGSLRFVIPAAGRQTLSGGFVAELQPIPVRRTTLASVPLGPKKAATITTFSDELGQWSMPAIEELLRTLISLDMAAAIDTVLVSNAAATATAPAGLRNGAVTVTPASTGTTSDKRQTDVAALIGAVQPSARVGLIVHPQQAASLADAGVAVFSTAAQAVGTVIAVDLTTFVMGDWGPPVFSMSNETALHLDDTTPLPLSAVGAPATIAAPTRSLFQEDLTAIKSVWRVNWTTLRANTTAAAVGVSW